MDTIAQIIAQPLAATLASGAARLLLAKGYAAVFARGRMGRTCDTSTANNYAAFRRDAGAAAKADEILCRTCVPKWVGLRIARGADYLSYSITDTEAHDALAAGNLATADFEVLPTKAKKPRRPRADKDNQNTEE
jgi:hypothetical protein